MRLSEARIDFMVTGSMAMSYYALPRMTRDIDVVLALRADDADRVVALFSPAYYVDAVAVSEAIRDQSTFNLIHKDSVVKVDCIPQRSTPFHVAEFKRRQQIALGTFSTWITSREDLVIAKLLRARESRSDVQLRDVRNLSGGGLDDAYVRQWTERLGLAELWNEAKR